MRAWLTVVAIALFGVSACSEEPPAPDHTIVQPGLPGEPNRTLSAEEAESALPDTEPNDEDVSYVRNMIIHHQQAVEMSALAPERAADERVRGLASRIHDVQGPEIGMMNRWLTGHDLPAVNPTEAHAHADMPGMATAEELAALTAARGPEFDRLFLELMIRHHEGAIEMARAVQVSGVDVRVQEMADDVIAEQADEIRRMREMQG
ncbi:DUF305 domain-containing protein [Actinokineospora fastidiosa]|uniref:Lipoprotein n=1 Tax=Actinokineospora fastidiosa TaxID=1816 RepID=A0A918LHU7_9PSEU|nr:DUF305 domain-containing protein [Actinokineospora fastidiosa]UVS78220.1 putative outer membrane protein [Actinokineospora sp. UTMC 2448]GGS48791.1 lipoprotein [Actinokineospora fastidiosa]